MDDMGKDEKIKYVGVKPDWWDKLQLVLTIITICLLLFFIIHGSYPANNIEGDVDRMVKKIERFEDTFLPEEEQ
jgi:hypothetical protein